MQNLLLIDTSMDACSAALRWQGQITERYEVCPQQHSQRILPMIDSLLDEAGATLTQLDGLGFGQGPGSFTGVRIATGVIQGLALGSQLPVVGISTLATMAQQCVQQTGCSRVIVVSDARMGEVYVGDYGIQAGGLKTLQPEQVLSPDKALEQFVEPVMASSVPVVGCGSGWELLDKLSCAGIEQVNDIEYPCARWMFNLADQAFRAGQTMDAANIEPVYVRNTVTWKKLPGR